MTYIPKKIQIFVTVAMMAMATALQSCDKDDDDQNDNNGKNTSEVPSTPETPSNPDDQSVNNFKERTEFTEHTRSMLKDLAENLNFSSWSTANTLNTYFNQYVLNNDEFSKSILLSYMLHALASIKPTEEGGELAEKGYEKYGIVDLTEFNYRFTMNDDNMGFTPEAADDFEVVLNGFNPVTQQIENGIYKVALQAGGSKSFKFVTTASQLENTALVIIIPSEFAFQISYNFDGTWTDAFTGTFNNEIEVAPGQEFAQLSDNVKISGTIYSDISAESQLATKTDRTALNFSIFSDRKSKKGDVAISWEQNERKMFDLTIKETSTSTNGLYNLDVTQFNSSSSIFDAFAVIFEGRTLNEAKLTLLDDLTTTISISDMPKAMQLVMQSMDARFDYADQQTIDSYTQELNKLVSMQHFCKGTNQTIPIRIETTKFGVDYVPMPSYKFDDEDNYVSVNKILDVESLEYGINILSHASEHVAQSIIVVRQLLQYVQSLASGTLPSEQQDE